MFKEARLYLKEAALSYDDDLNTAGDHSIRECWDRMRVELEKDPSINQDDIFVFDTMIGSTKRQRGYERVIETLNVMAFFENLVGRRAGMEVVKKAAED